MSTAARSVIWHGFFGSLGAGLATGVGAIGVFFIRRLSDWLLDVAANIAVWVVNDITTLHQCFPQPLSCPSNPGFGGGQ